MTTKPAPPATCICGRTFKNKLGFNPHARTCPQERARSDAFIDAVESGDWTAYRAQYGIAPR